MSEVLTQSQIDALLNSMQGGTAEETLDVAEAKKEEKKYKKYDFYSPKKFTRDKLKILRGIYENYARVVSSRINSILRASCLIEILGVEEQRYYEFANSLNDNDVLTLITVKNQEGESVEPAVMKVDTAVMLAMIDHMLGGSSEDEEEDVSSYTYTDIELRIYNIIVKYIIDVMADGWVNYLDIDFSLNRIETNPTMMQEISRDESVAIIILNISIDAIHGNITICLPDSVLSSAFRIMDSKTSHDNLTEDEKEETSKMIFDHIKKSSLEIKAELGKSRLLLKDVYGLQVGDVINLNKTKDSEVYLTIADKTWFKGYLGTNNKNMAIKISDIYNDAPVSSQKGE
ncbi:MAG: flagellar motor switch protein FliM [Clostridiales bacterium]|nr:flagellar motor switch protein FliM [Clostridiales bacterium]